MPELEINATRLHYVELGEGNETVVLSHSYLVDHHHFERQIEALRGRYRVLAYDHRGHGESAKERGHCTMETLYTDGVAFLEALGRGRVHWVGLSTGGFVGMRIAFRRPELLSSLTLLDTAASGEPWFRRLRFEAMFTVLRLFGFRPLMGEVMKTMFGPAFLKDPQRREQRDLWRQRIMDNDTPALITFGRAIFSRDDVSGRLGEIALPTLVMVGEHDHATPLARARVLAERIPGAHLETIPRAGHLSTIEEPEFVNDKLLAFLARC
jgi:3-oxoadipate enol-lactonase